MSIAGEPDLSQVDPNVRASVVVVRVPFRDTDLMGIVHHSNYLAYFEVARVEWLRRRGVAYGEWANAGIHLPVVEVGLRYRSPAFFDDVLDVRATLAELRTCSLRFRYEVTRGGENLADGETRLACVNDERRLRRFTESDYKVLTSPEAPEWSHRAPR